MNTQIFLYVPLTDIEAQSEILYQHDILLENVCLLMFPATPLPSLVRNPVVKRSMVEKVSPVEKPPTMTRCGLVLGANPGDVKYVRCVAGSEGRFVTVSAPGRQMLSLKEVQVYGEEGDLLIYNASRGHARRT